jgi:lipopolysaccharide/colanic/teichoic acid biosynthesis glycosyltransferase
MDVTAAWAGIVLLSPLLVCIAALVKMQDGGPAFHRGLRVGRGGEPFRLYKFRTMVVDAHRQGPGITVQGDRRVTRLGRVLRRTKLDELPQLVNVLLGDMSLVGARPEDPLYAARFTAAEREILNHRPGITSPASLAFRAEDELLDGPDWQDRYVNEVLPAKLALDLAYLSRRRCRDDVALVCRTVRALIMR